MTKWEYRVETVKNPEVHSLGEHLNRLGAEGWELMSTVSTIKTWVNLSGNDIVIVMKREGVGVVVERPEDQPGFVPY